MNQEVCDRCKSIVLVYGLESSQRVQCYTVCPDCVPDVLTDIQEAVDQVDDIDEQVPAILTAFSAWLSVVLSLIALAMFTGGAGWRI